MFHTYVFSRGTYFTILPSFMSKSVAKHSTKFLNQPTSTLEEFRLLSVMQYTVTTAAMGMSLLDLRGYDEPEPQLLQVHPQKFYFPQLAPSQWLCLAEMPTRLFLDTRNPGGPLGCFDLSMSFNLLRSNCPLRHPSSLPLPAFLSPSFKVRTASGSDGSLIHTLSSRTHF